MGIKSITSETYMDLAQNGVRALFDYHGFRLLDGDKYEGENTEDGVTSYFLIDFAEEEGREEGEIYQLSADCNR
jgi:hypothetical protein